MAVPHLTAQERKDALEKAAQARKARADLKHQVKYSKETISSVLERAQSDEAIAKMRVVELLESLPGIGQVRARAIMAECGIAPSRRLRGLGAQQRLKLVDRFG